MTLRGGRCKVGGMSRRGLIIRALIFGPLFIYFGFAAIQKCRLEQQTADDAAKRDAEIRQNSKTIDLPNGKSMQVIELTPEEAAAKYGYKPPEIGPAKTPAEPAKAPEEVKAPEAKAPEAKAPEAKAN